MKSRKPNDLQLFIFKILSINFRLLLHFFKYEHYCVSDSYNNMSQI